MRDFLNAEDVVEIIYKIYTKKLCGIYNIGSGKGITVKSFIEKQFNLKNITVQNEHINSLVSNNTKLIKKIKMNKKFKHKLAHNTIEKSEIFKLSKWLLKDEKLTMGNKTKLFQKNFLTF